MAKEKTALEEIQKLQEQIEKKKQEALDELEGDLREARATVRDIEKQIADLKGRSPRKAGEREKKDAPCSICGFKTNPVHDARSHRSQGKKKEAFTAAELREKGMEKVA